MFKLKKIDGFQLKIIAAITMLIDHIGYVFSQFLPRDIYVYLRSVGRLSFPIFAFLLVEGFVHTKNRLNYLSRLLGVGVAIILGLGSLSLFGLQVPVQLNIFITLSMGFFALWLIEYLWKTSATFTILGVIGIAIMTEMLRADYGAYGVFSIVIFYVWRDRNWTKGLVFTGLTCSYVLLDILQTQKSSVLQLLAILALPLILLYNGTRGNDRFRYFFYAFYPLHFVVLSIIRFLLYGV